MLKKFRPSCRQNLSKNLTENFCYPKVDFFLNFSSTLCNSQPHFLIDFWEPYVVNIVEF